MLDPIWEARQFFVKNRHASEVMAMQHFKEIDSDPSFVIAAMREFTRLRVDSIRSQGNRGGDLDVAVNRIWPKDRYP